VIVIGGVDGSSNDFNHGECTFSRFFLGVESG
jgi:hypothetical protein